MADVQAQLQALEPPPAAEVMERAVRFVGAMRRAVPTVGAPLRVTRTEQGDVELHYHYMTVFLDGQYSGRLNRVERHSATGAALPPLYFSAWRYPETVEDVVDSFGCAFFTGPRRAGCCCGRFATCAAT